MHSVTAPPRGILNKKEPLLPAGSPAKFEDEAEQQLIIATMHRRRRDFTEMVIMNVMGSVIFVTFLDKKRTVQNTTQMKSNHTDTLK